jgi:hypothetical protein
LTRVPIRRVRTKSRRSPRQPLNFVAVEEIGATDGTRTRALRSHNLMQLVTVRPSVSENSAYLWGSHPRRGRTARRQAVEAEGAAEIATDDTPGGCRSGSSSEPVARARILVVSSARACRGLPRRRCEEVSYSSIGSSGFIDRASGTGLQEQHVGGDFGNPDEDRPPPPGNKAVSRGL